MLKPNEKNDNRIMSRKSNRDKEKEKEKDKPRESPTAELQFNLELHANAEDASTSSVDINNIIERLVDYAIYKKPSPMSASHPTPSHSSSSNSVSISSSKHRNRNKKFHLSSDEIGFICAKARQIFLSQPMLLELASPVKVVGDIHGQFNDLIRIFKLCGFPPSANYLFLGDYVDRGKQSLETIMLLLCLKIKFPENFFLLRGNHECASITKMYGFYDECKRRSSIKTWKNIVDVFNTMPVAATIANKIFCVHGGLSPDLRDLNQIKSIRRPTDIPDEGLLADILWSDPFERTTDDKFKNSKELRRLEGHGQLQKSVDASEDTQNINVNVNIKTHNDRDWIPNDRGVSYQFTERAIKKFLNRFNFDLIVRGHMVVEDGYEFYGKRKLVTVFSAPNYCGEFGNWGAVMNVEKELKCSFELLRPTRK